MKEPQGLTNMKNTPADLTSHHIEGYARMAEGDGQFSCPLITQVVGDLWQGGTPAELGYLPDYFKFVVNLYPWERYRVPEATTVLTCPLYDSNEGPSRALLETLGIYVARVSRIGPTLVHCQAGLNRSALVTGMALRQLGYTGDLALNLLRKRSPRVLCNKTFESILLSA